MKKRFVNESDAYNELMHNVSNSSILSELIKNRLESLINSCLNYSRRDGVNNLSEAKMLADSEDSMLHYNEIKTLFEWDNLLSDKYKTYILKSILFIMKEKRASEKKRIHGNKK